ncbi:MAG: adenylate kinase family protein [Halobacteriota archaeon]|nr:adenylate kinase family protein [Halobacteriota archaeon]
MIVAVTGTPGTGKTSATRLLEDLYPVIHINELVKEKEFYVGVDEMRDCLIADTEKISEYVHGKHKEIEKDRVLIIECHYSHLLCPDITIVLKTDTSVLMGRLEAKGFGKHKMGENIEAEIMGVILVEAVEICKDVNIIDTTKKSVEDVARSIKETIETGV